MKKNMTGKSRMLVVGIVLGAAGAALLAALIAGGKLGWIGLLAVLLLAALASLSGWMIGIQMRIKAECGKAWTRGYEAGCENGLLIARADCRWEAIVHIGEGR